ncbi:AAA family ATPase [Nocardia sp. NPDC005998]|uniref:AAA family ATPase n=1 Tax=Nocardia sp. NPDC005998 TaxID=3156894 RepID=UPI0033B29EF3
MASPLAAPLVTAIKVRDLFGKRSYDVVVPEIDKTRSRLLLLHGSNGSGKTTLLRLLWHALSAADNKGHRTYLAKTPFSELTIEMSGDRKLYFKKSDGLVGSYSVTLTQPGIDDCVAHYESDENLRVRRHNLDTSWIEFESEMVNYAATRALLDQRSSFDRPFTSRAEIEISGSPREVEKRIARALKSRRANEQYLEFLSEEVRTPLYLADDRSLNTDDPDTDRMRNLVSGGRERDRQERLSELVYLELRVTLERVNEYLRSITIGGQNEGSANSNVIYTDVLKQLVISNTSSDGKRSNISEMHALLDEIERISPPYETYGLVPKFDTQEFRQLFRAAEDRGLDALVERVVSPFLVSQRARYAALESACDLLESLIPTLNSFLSEKEIRFTPRSGLAIYTADDEPLQVDMLSSGERQLLTLLCTTLTAVDKRLFIIDEPELSLGVNWQRQIIDALLSVTDKSNLQFIVATHSIEIISARPESLVQLKSI